LLVQNLKLNPKKTKKKKMKFAPTCLETKRKRSFNFLN
jgi:hypothetical protein